MVDEIMVSFCLVTYNHEKYIYNTLKSIVESTFTFDYEIIIGNDNSKDSTEKEIQKFIKDYPDVNITAFNRKKNLGVAPNYLDIVNNSKGKYVLLLDGDDFFEFSGEKIDLEGYLRSENDCLIFSFKHFYEAENRNVPYNVNEIDFAKSLDGLFYHLGSVFFKKTLLIKFISDDWVLKYNFLDRQLQIDIVRLKNKILFPNTFLSVYRIHSISESNKMSNVVVLEKVILMLLEYCFYNNSSLRKDYVDAFRKRIFSNLLLLCHPLNSSKLGLMSKYLSSYHYLLIENFGRTYMLKIRVACYLQFFLKYRK
jgi:glycosyltransferase involved in cell wall biosynthesis